MWCILKKTTVNYLECFFETHTKHFRAKEIGFSISSVYVIKQSEESDQWHNTKLFVQHCCSGKLKMFSEYSVICWESFYNTYFPHVQCTFQVPYQHTIENECGLKTQRYLIYISFSIILVRVSLNVLLQSFCNI